MAEEKNINTASTEAEKPATKTTAQATTTAKRTTSTKKGLVSVKEPEAEATGKNFTESEVRAMIAEALREQRKELDEQLAKQNSQPQVIMQVKSDETVTLLFLGAIADGTVVDLGKLGQINRAGGTIDVPKTEFFQNLNYTVERLLQKRKLIVVNGLTDNERERFGVAYKEGELLTQKTYYKILDLDIATLKAMYAKLCDEHKRIVATMFITAYEKGDLRVNTDKVKALNKLSRKVTNPFTGEPEKDGLFTPILEDMGKQMLKDDED